MPVTATTTPISGKLLRISLSATLGGTYVLIKGMNATEKTSSKTTTTTATYDDPNAFIDTATPEKTYRVDGLVEPADPGQQAVRAADAADSVQYYKFLPQGGSSDANENVLGWTHPCKVGSSRWGAPVGGAQTWGFDLVSQGAEAITTNGYIW
jgi:hypothetical protein